MENGPMEALRPLFESTTPAPDTRPGLHWLIRLRWLSLAGQAAVCLLAAFVLKIALFWGILIACMGVTAATNLAVSLFSRQTRLRESVLCAILLALDTMTLTVMLYWSGGSHNPFTTFYLLHITIGAILLTPAWAWAGVVLCGICYSLLFQSPFQLENTSGSICCGNFDFHRHGLFLAMVLAGVFIAFFVGKLNLALLRRDQELNEARIRDIRHERFASLATLAAGVAHELATPLGTIAIASADIEHHAHEKCHQEGCLKDARLIRSEVERCRRVLENLGERTTDGVGDPPERFALRDIPQMLENYLKPEYNRRTRTEITTSAKTLFAPRTTLLQALAILIKNACEASAADTPVFLTIRDEDNNISFLVEDQGEGMTSRILERAGEPFFTTKKPGFGMGLGLFLARTFAERMRGRLDVLSTPQQGTRVRLIFPFPEGLS